jgi:hypothetical protein
MFSNKISKVGIISKSFIKPQRNPFISSCSHKNLVFCVHGRGFAAVIEPEAEVKITPRSVDYNQWFVIITSFELQK